MMSKLVSLVVAISLIVFALPSNGSAEKTASEYRTWGTILASGAGLFFILAVVKYSDAADHSKPAAFGSQKDADAESKAASMGHAFMVAAVGSGVGSILCFTRAAKLGKRSAFLNVEDGKLALGIPQIRYAPSVNGYSTDIVSFHF